MAKSMLDIALGKGRKPDADEDLEDEEAMDPGLDDEEDTEDEPMDHESAVADDLVDAGFSQEKADALVDAIKALIETRG